MTGARRTRRILMRSRASSTVQDSGTVKGSRVMTSPTVRAARSLRSDSCPRTMSRSVTIPTGRTRFGSVSTTTIAPM